MSENSKTQIARITLTSDEFSDVQDIVDYINKPDKFVSFAEGLAEFMAKCGYDGSSDSTERYKYILKSAKERNVILSDSARRTFSNWVKGDDEYMAQCNAASRENVYLLCFALGFDYETTKLFFEKVYFDRAFNCRCIEEAVYKFAMKNGIGYAEMQEIIDECRTIVGDTNVDAEATVKTSVLTEKIDSFKDKEELLAFVKHNKSEFGVNTKTARNTAIELVDAVKKKMVKYNSENEKLSRTQLIEKLIVSDAEAIPIEQRKEQRKKIREDKRYLKALYQNFPNKEIFSQVLDENKEPSNDTLRKMLILMSFCDRYIDYHLKADDEIPFEYYDELDDFEQETNDLLERCGFGPLYPRNPYDFLFYNCVGAENYSLNYDSPNPIAVLGEILEGIFNS